MTKKYAKELVLCKRCSSLFDNIKRIHKKKSSDLFKRCVSKHEFCSRCITKSKTVR